MTENGVPLDDEERTIPQRQLGAVKRRREPRVPADPSTEGWILVGRETGVYEALKVVVVNVSASGIGLLVGRSLPGGAELLLQLDCHRAVGPGPLPLRVAHITKQAAGEWLVGCQFARPLGPGELESLRAPAVTY